jgi:hypothetical protein
LRSLYRDREKLEDLMKLRHSLVTGALAMGLGAGSLNAQSVQAGSASHSLGTVSIEHPVLANRHPLTPGRYDVHLTNEWPDPLEPGEQQGMQWVAFRTGAVLLGGKRRS